MDEPLLLRPAEADDVPALFALAHLLNTLNLPGERSAVEALVDASVRSFTRAPDAPGTYTLVAVRGGRILGAASLFARHGTPDDPHYFLQVVDRTVRSRQLGETRTRRVLKLGKDVTPWTELGGLVVHPDARGQGIGKLLVAARLLLVAMHPRDFCDRLLAELLPPRREDGANAFWDAVGKRFTGLDFYRADLLCRTDKEFLEAFFPGDELPVELLPTDAQAIVGTVGAQTLPVRRVLTRAGFHFLGTVDPFDAGPHDGATLDEIAPIRGAERRVLLDHPPGSERTAAPSFLVAVHRHHWMHACNVTARPGEGLRLTAPATATLEAEPGDPCTLLPLDW